MEFTTLKNKENKKTIKDIILHPLRINRDESGVLVETLRKDWPSIYGPGREFFMQYYSITPFGVARDENVWHLHPSYQEDRFLIVQGSIITAVADIRDDSDTKGLLNLFYMDSLSEPYILLIPKNTLHGFMVVSEQPAILLNYPTGLYNPDEEKRIPYEEADIKTEEAELFSWNLVRKQFPALSSK